MSQLPPEIGQLSNLSSLDLSFNKLNQLPPEIGQLSNLSSLNISHDQLSQLPPEIAQLTKLSSLYLWGNQLSQLPPEIAQLTKLSSLYLSGKQMNQLSPEIGQLANLTSLHLSGNQLNQLPPEVAQLTKLSSLYLSGNQLNQLPSEIGQLANLTSLDLSFNQLNQLPSEIGQLSNLTSLDLRDNQLSQLPPEIAQLSNLTSLGLRDNQLSQLPPEIAQLSNLTSLDLRDNQLSQLPPEIGQLSNLTSLDLRGNQLSQLPPEITKLLNLKKLDLRGNPLPIPPEILGPKESWRDPGDVKAILDFYFRVQDPSETELLYEAKFLIVGEGGAGKTSLAKKIENAAYQLQPDETSTKGIEVIRWHFSLPSGQDFRVNIWDFGGQEVYHHTHQFFLTERSLYALVVDTRQENTDLYYWLHVVELLSDNSPVLIIKNEKQERQCEVNQRQLRGEFTNLKEVLATNLATNRGLPEIKTAIQHYISQLPHVGTPLPKLWVRVRIAIENDSRNYISLDEYCQLCRTNGLSDRQDMLRLSQYLHDLGVCLHFQADPVLKWTVILKPEWGTNAVYKVLDNQTVIQNLGCFTQADLADIWKHNQYADMRDELLHLMMRFKLCYEIPGRSGTYIAPNLLSTDQPDYTWDDTNNLVLRYEYEFMPKGILTRFIVEMHRWIEEQKQVWKNGVILNNSRARAEVIEYYRDRKGEIHICVSGIHKKELLSIIDYKFLEIHDSYERLKYDTFISCNCTTCSGSSSPYDYPLKTLQQFLNDKQYEIQCRNSYRMVNVRGLIDDSIPQANEDQPDSNLRLKYRQRSQQSQAESFDSLIQHNPMPEPILRNQVFVSYSHQDKDWLTQFQKNLKPLIRNKTLTAWDDTQIKPGAEWRKEIETALAAAKVAVLMVSPDFLASDFIADNELPPLLDAAQAEGLTIIWIPISYSLYEETEIEKYQAAHPPNQPLDSLSPSDRNRAWVTICKHIKNAASL